MNIAISNNYSDTSGSYGSLKEMNHLQLVGNPDNICVDNSTSFKCKSSFLKPLTAADNGVFKNVKIAIPLKYLSNFWRSLVIPLISCKIHLELN